jgi:DNA topoisomerase-2
VEPLYFVPVIPFALINGAEGVGTGWSTSLPTFSPLDVIDNVRRKLDGRPMQQMRPFTRGFAGKVG